LTTSTAAPPPPPATAAQEWKANWTLVLAAMVGASFGSIPSVTLGLFMEPLNLEFGWNRAEISLGMTIFALISLPLAPLGGALVDKFGGRKVGIPGLALTGLTFASFSLLGDWIGYYLTIWVLYSLASLLIRTLVWNTTVSTVFSAGRGLALAVVIAGLSLPQMLAPPLTEGLIAGYGWRNAYLALGLGWAGIALLLVVLFFKVRNVAQTSMGGPAQESKPLKLGGLTLKKAIRTPAILRITGAIALQSLIGTGAVIHLVPILTSHGTSRIEAAGMATILGIGSLAGNLFAGWLADKVRSSFLPFTFFALPAAGYTLILVSTGMSLTLTAGVLCLGFGSGGALQQGVYLTTRYAGMRNFGKIYGLITSFQTLTSGIGPVVAGAVFDATSSYSPFLMVAIPTIFLAGLLVFGLGTYPEFAPEDEN